MYTLHWLIIFLFLITSSHKTIHYILYQFENDIIWYDPAVCSRFTFSGAFMQETVWHNDLRSALTFALFQKNKRKMFSPTISHRMHTHTCKHMHAKGGRTFILACFLYLLALLLLCLRVCASLTWWSILHLLLIDQVDTLASHLLTSLGEGPFHQRFQTSCSTWLNSTSNFVCTSWP